MDERARILDAVKRAGFDRVGCAPIEAGFDERMDAWLSAGFHGSMAWLEQHAEVRRAPRRYFRRYRSVVIAALEYGTAWPPASDPRIGNISRYALSEDYHAVLKRRLLRARDLAGQAVPGLRARVFVDAGPLGEKLLAARAGLGFQGKHTNLIDPRTGSYFFLGQLLVDRDLPPTGPSEPDRCGTCTACIPACPTGAIVAPYVLDARLCISYLTIEHPGSIPRELRPAIGNRIFGCDDCQEVCPWNRFARTTVAEGLEPRAGLRERTLAAWLELDEAAWLVAVGGTAVERTGYRGFLRNVLVSAGCSRDAGLVPVVARFLRHDDALLREHAAWALGALGGSDAASVLAERTAIEPDAAVRNEIRAALSCLDRPAE